jgi:hypothetical protein
MPVLKVKIVPWDDADFVRAYEHAAGELAAEGVSLHDPMAALELQRRLRASGYPDAVCYCERTVEEAMAHQARCVVARDRSTAARSGLAPV